MVMRLGLTIREGEPMPSGPAAFACCDRCANLAADSTAGAQRGHLTAGAGATAATATVARRRILKAAVVRPQPDAGTDERLRTPSRTARRDARVPAAAIGHLPPSPRAGHTTGFADVSQLPRTVFGIIQDVSPQVLVLGEAGREQRFALTGDAVGWRGSQLEPAALRQGDHAVVRLSPSSRNIADRIWANIGRVTGIILERSGGTLVVDEGATRQPQVITLLPRAVGRIQVRFPTLEPGYLVDIIGLRHDGELIGMIPATSQPAYPAHRLPAPPLISGHVAHSISGSVTWHEARDEPPSVLGASYPALDPETACAEEAASATRQSFARMPYLAIGSVLRVKNDCTGTECLLPVTGCATIARLFNDRCVTCGTSPRGRIADLTLASFVALGGELERGCFNATITIGE